MKPVGAGNLCHQAILMNNASGTVAALDPELIQAGDAIGQRRGLVQGSVRPVPAAEVLVLARHDHQMPLIPYQGPVQQLTPAAADPAFHDRIHPRRLDRGAGNPDARSLEHRAGCGGEAGVPVGQDELCPCPGVFQVHEQVPGLPHYPRLDRMPGGSGDPDAAGAVPGDGKDAGLRAVEQAGGEEVQCQDPLRLGPEERPAPPSGTRSSTRLFSHITMNWQGRPLTSHEVIVQAIAATTSRTGLRVRADLDTATYLPGVKIGDEQMAAHPLRRHDWNYALYPAPPAPAPARSPRPGRGERPGWAHPALTGMTASGWDQLTAVLAVPYQAQREAELHIARGRPATRRAAGGHPQAMTLAEKTLVTIMRQRLAVPPAHPGRPVRRRTQYHRHSRTPDQAPAPAGWPQYRARPHPAHHHGRPHRIRISPPHRAAELVAKCRPQRRERADLQLADGGLAAMG